MINKDGLRNVPHFDLIREDETIEVFSVFDFKGGHEELFPFLYGCEKMNCTVVFKNEDITVRPNRDENDSLQGAVLSLYAWVAKVPKLAEDYMRYMASLSDVVGTRQDRRVGQGAA